MKIELRLFHSSNTIFLTWIKIKYRKLKFIIFTSSCYLENAAKNIHIKTQQYQQIVVEMDLFIETITSYLIVETSYLVLVTTVKKIMVWHVFFYNSRSYATIIFTKLNRYMRHISYTNNGQQKCLDFHASLHFLISLSYFPFKKHKMSCQKNFLVLKQVLIFIP